MAGLGLGHGGVAVAAREAADFTGWLGWIEQAHQEALRRSDDRAALKKWLGCLDLGRRLRLRIAMLPRFRKARHRAIPNHALALANLEVGATRPALRGNHHGGFRL